MSKVMIAACAVLLVGVIWQHTIIHDLRSQLASLQDGAAQADATKPLPDSPTPSEPQAAPTAELLSLRSEVGILRRQLQSVTNEYAKSKREAAAKPQPAPPQEPAEDASVVPGSSRRISGLPPDMTEVDLGAIVLSPSVQQRISISPGTNCVLDPTVLPDGNIEIRLALESITAAGTNRLPDEGVITARPGQQVGMGLGNLMVNLTPSIKGP